MQIPVFEVSMYKATAAQWKSYILTKTSNILLRRYFCWFVHGWGRRVIENKIAIFKLELGKW